MVSGKRRKTRRVVGLPVSVREVVGRRAATLGDEITRVLGAAAVLGRDFDTGVLEQLLDNIHGDALDRALDSAIAASVLDDIPGRPRGSRSRMRCSNALSTTT